MIVKHITIAFLKTHPLFMANSQQNLNLFVEPTQIVHSIQDRVSVHTRHQQQ